MRAFSDVAPYTHLVDVSEDHPLSFFGPWSAWRTPRSPTRRWTWPSSVGMGGSWGATNVADAQVAQMVLPVTVDHARYLSETAAEIAVEKAGIISRDPPRSRPARPDVAGVLLGARRSAPRWLGEPGFGVVPGARGRRTGGLAAGAAGAATRVFLPLYGAHQAQNAAVAGRRRAFLGDAEQGRPLDDEVVRAAFAG